MQMRKENYKNDLFKYTRTTTTITKRIKTTIRLLCSNLTHDANIELNQLNNNVLEQINDLLSKRIDDSLIKQLETVNQQLDPLLN